MTSALSLYFGETMHVRLSPFTHRFRYPIASILIDVDQLEAADRTSRWFSVDRFNLLSFHARDHGARGASTLREWVEESLRRHGLTQRPVRISLFCFPRFLGYVFNPISVWSAYDEADELIGVIYEVNNTFGDTHAYVVPGSAALHAGHQADKRLYVSPFFDREGEYRFRLTPPGPRFRLSILYRRSGAPALTALHQAQREVANDQSVLRAFWRFPVMTMRVSWSIHWQALKLFLRGARFHSRPPAGAASSLVSATRQEKTS